MGRQMVNERVVLNLFIGALYVCPGVCINIYIYNTYFIGVYQYVNSLRYLKYFIVYTCAFVHVYTT